jgi:hypothetical protein
MTGSFYVITGSDIIRRTVEVGFGLIIEISALRHRKIEGNRKLAEIRASLRLSRRDSELHPSVRLIHEVRHPARVLPIDRSLILLLSSSSVIIVPFRLRSSTASHRSSMVNVQTRRWDCGRKWTRTRGMRDGQY